MKYLIEEYLNNLEKEARNSIQITLNEYPDLLKNISASRSSIPYNYSGPQILYTSSYFYPNIFVNKVGDICVQIDETVHVIGKLCEYETSD